MKLMDDWPTVVTCCFCCFLRAGTLMISIFSFIVGIIFAPNVSHVAGFWDMSPVLSYYSTKTELTAQMTLGLASIAFSCVSILLFIGALFSIPKLITIYQWGAVLYSVTVVLMFLVLAMSCFFVHSNCYTAGAILLLLIICNVLLTIYFLIVTNSLRISLKYSSNEDIMI